MPTFFDYVSQIMGGVNLYEYVHNVPINLFDSDGMQRLEKCNRCQIVFRFFCVTEIRLRGWNTVPAVKMDISISEKQHFHLVAHGEDVELELVSEFLRVDKVVGYEV